MPLGLHFSWNWTMNGVLGIPVSGITKFAPAPLFTTLDLGPAWLTGVDSGLEGGAACTLALLVSALFIWFAPFFNAAPEMLQFTGKENPKPKEPVSINYEENKI